MCNFPKHISLRFPVFILNRYCLCWLIWTISNEISVRSIQADRKMLATLLYLSVWATFGHCGWSELYSIGTCQQTFRIYCCKYKKISFKEKCHVTDLGIIARVPGNINYIFHCWAYKYFYVSNRFKIFILLNWYSNTGLKISKVMKTFFFLIKLHFVWQHFWHLLFYSKTVNCLILLDENKI